MQKASLHKAGLPSSGFCNTLCLAYHPALALEKLNADMSFFQAASELQVPPELLDFKFRMMKRNGVQIVDSPITANSNFLKDIPTEGIIENY